MTTCPDCGTDLPAEASFCRSCGSSVRETCPKCGTSVTANADFCPDCGEALSAAVESKNTASDEVMRLRPTEFARRVDGEDIQSGGLVSRLLRQKREVKIEAGNRALLLENGALEAEIGPGKHTLDSLGQKIKDLRRAQSLSAVLVEEGNTVVTLTLDDIRTASEYPVDTEVELVVTIDEPELLFTSLMADRDVVTTETFQRLLGGALRDELEATLADYEPEELYGNRELRRNLRQGLERQCRATFERTGLRLVELRSLSYEDDRDEIRQRRKEVDIREEREEIEDHEAELDRREVERDTEDAVHEERQRVRRETAEQTADHEVEKQVIEQEHEKDYMQRRHRHEAEREEAEHQEDVATTRKEKEIERRDLEHEQDVEEIEDLVDLKGKKERQKLNREKREQEIELQREQREVEMEKERLEARDDVDIDTVASLEAAADDVQELAELAKMEDLDADQIEAFYAKNSDELAKARQEANDAEKERLRVEDQQEFREELREVMEGSMDRMQETTESAMDNMGETGRAAAEDTSDNVIVSDPGGSSDSGDTTIVQGGGGGSDGGDRDTEPGRRVTCPECEQQVTSDSAYCTNCGTEF